MTVVLLHGISGSAKMWDRVVPLLSASHEALAITTLGHRGGTVPSRNPVLVTDLVDDLEHRLDSLGLERVHLAGNSLGGWVALELARRGRALSVCALSPAGMWCPKDHESRQRAERKLRAVARQTRLGRVVLPLLARSAAFRAWCLRDNARDGSRVAPRDLVFMADDLLGCSALHDLLSTNEAFSPMASISVPTTVAWSEYDKIFPPATYLSLAQDLIPQAKFLVLQNVGHVPMLDDPALVAETILDSIRRGVDAEGEKTPTTTSVGDRHRSASRI